MLETMQPKTLHNKLRYLILVYVWTLNLLAPGKTMTWIKNKDNISFFIYFKYTLGPLVFLFILNHVQWESMILLFRWFQLACWGDAIGLLRTKQLIRSFPLDCGVSREKGGDLQIWESGKETSLMWSADDWIKPLSSETKP